MEDIKVKSSIGFKTYFNISLLIGVRLKAIVMTVAVAAFVSYLILSYWSLPLWGEIMVTFATILAYTGIILLTMYLSCRRNMKRSAYLTEPLVFSLNEENVAVKGDTVSSTTGWQHYVTLMERKEYFLLLTAMRTFYYLPKWGFASGEEMTRFKDMVREKGIKMTYR